MKVRNTQYAIRKWNQSETMTVYLNFPGLHLGIRYNHVH
jgi:hypothetical protein